MLNFLFGNDQNLRKWSKWCGNHLKLLKMIKIDVNMIKI